MSLINMLTFKAIGDEKGSLVALESDGNIPFNIKRVYYIFDTKQGVSRGFHAHRNLKQVVVCIVGSCCFVLDDGQVKEEVVLDCPTKGLMIEGLVWREMYDFSLDCVLMVLANKHYDELDYIRNYNDFLEAVNDKT